MQDKRLTLRLRPEEYDALVERAELLECRPTTLARRAVLRAAGFTPLEVIAREEAREESWVENGRRASKKSSENARLRAIAQKLHSAS